MLPMPIDERRKFLLIVECRCRNPPLAFTADDNCSCNTNKKGSLQYITRQACAGLLLPRYQVSVWQESREQEGGAAKRVNATRAECHACSCLACLLLACGFQVAFVSESSS